MKTMMNKIEAKFVAENASVAIEAINHILDLLKFMHYEEDDEDIINLRQSYANMFEVFENYNVK